MPKTDAIERQISVTSPIERVWEALTVAEHLAEWFGDSAEVDLRPGGTMRVGWSEYDATAECVVETVEPPTRFAYRWDVGESDDGTVWSTTVTFTLHEEDGTTTVKVVESGLSRLPDDLHQKTIEENASGWEGELEDLRVLLEGARTS